MWGLNEWGLYECGDYMSGDYMSTGTIWVGTICVRGLYVFLALGTICVGTKSNRDYMIVMRGQSLSRASGGPGPTSSGSERSFSTLSR